jgi:hypothetical protein
VFSHLNRASVLTKEDFHAVELIETVAAASRWGQLGRAVLGGDGRAGPGAGDYDAVQLQLIEQPGIQ